MKKRNLFVGAMLIMTMAAAGCSSQKNAPEPEEVVEELPEATETWNKEIEEVKEEVEEEVVQEAEAGEEADKVAEDNTNVDAASTGDVVSICDEDTQFDYDKDYKEVCLNACIHDKIGLSRLPIVVKEQVIHNMYGPVKGSRILLFAKDENCEMHISV